VTSRPIRVLALVLDDLLRLSEGGSHVKEISLGEIEKAGIRLTEPRSRLDDLVENRLKAKTRPAQSPEDVRHPLLSAAKLVELPGQVDDSLFVRGEVRQGADR
jgi:hypothetical protein